MDELKNMPIWVCWRYSKGKKIPKSAKGGSTGVNEHYKDTWVTFDEANAALKSHPNKFNGLCFRVPKGYFFLDIDNRLSNSALSSKLIDRFDSYAEMSVSGNGQHIYGKCDISRLPIHDGKLDKRFYIKNPHADLELYIGGVTNRFAVYTGNAIANKPLNDCTQAVLDTLHDDMQKPGARIKAQQDLDNIGRTYDDISIIMESLMNAKNGFKFQRLYCDGDISDYNNDDSAADSALCTMIAFRTGNYPEMIDAIFRGSALYRDKWERDDYRERTISFALDSCNGVFHHSVKPIPDFIYTNQSGQYRVNAALLAKHIKQNLQYILVRDNAKTGVLFYVYEAGCYKLYAPDMVKGIIKTYIAGFMESVVRMSDLNEVYSLMTTDLDYIRQCDLNSDEGIINFQNGLLRLSDMKLLPHSPEVLSTIQLQCNWTGSPSPTPRYDKYVATLVNNDSALVDYLYQWLGLILSNIKGYKLKKALFLVGKGNTGKSIFRRLATLLLGPGNHVSIDLTSLEARFGTGAIYGTRLAGSADMSFMTVNELKTFKQITGGDSIFAEFKGQQAFEYTYDGLLCFCMNKLPKFGGDNGKWVYDRIAVVKCDNVIPDNRQDKLLAEKLYTEREGIIFNAIMALKSVMTNGYRFNEPFSVAAVRTEYRSMNNTIIGFCNECLTSRPADDNYTDEYTSGRIYGLYKIWCRDNNNGYHKTAKEFREQLAEYLDIPQLIKHTRKGNYLLGITVKAEALQDYNSDFLA